MAKFPRLPTGMVSGLLLPAEKAAVAQKVSEKGGPRPCEVCGTNKWTVGDYLVSPMGLARWDNGQIGQSPGDPIHPSVLLFCSNCGNAKQLNALILGLDIDTGETGETDV